MAGAGAEGIVHHDHGQRPDAMAFALEQVRFGNLLLQRTARQFDAQGVFLDGPVFLAQPLGTGILVAGMTDDAVVHLAEGFAGRHAQVGEAEAVAVAPSLGRALEERGQLRIVELAGHQVVEVQLLGMHEGGKLAAPLFQFGVKGQHPRPGRNVAQQLLAACRLRSVSPGFGGCLAVEQLEDNLGQFPLGIVGPFSPREDFRHPFPVAKLDVGDVHGRQFLRSRRHFQHQAIQEAFLEFVHRPVVGGAPIQVVHFLFDVEKAGDEAIQVPGDVDEELRIFLALAAGIAGRNCVRSARRGPGPPTEAHRETPGRGPSAGVRD